MKNNKGVAPILIILIIIGILALGAGMYYFLVKKTQKPVACTEEAKICPDGSTVVRTGPNCEFAECPAVKVDETANWQTYRNEEYGFELKYPLEWQELKNYYSLPHEKELFFIVFSTDGTDTNMKDGKVKENWAKVDITNTPRNPDEDIRDLFKDAPIEDKPQSSEVVVIDGIESMKALGVRYYDMVLYIPKNNYYYQISLITTNKDFYEPIFNQMLSTFKFIEISPQTTPAPSIDSISPNSGPIGTVIEIRGKNFSGFEGALDAWIENAEGVKGIIYGETGSNESMIKFTLKSSFCQIDTSYSGLPCSGFLNITPGIYKIYVVPWGQKSNEVTFTVISP